MRRAWVVVGEDEFFEEGGKRVVGCCGEEWFEGFVEVEGGCDGCFGCVDRQLAHGWC